jgi:hypothetical protein
MPSSRTLANLEIRATEDHPSPSDSATALDDAVREAAKQTPEGATRQVAFVLTWLDGGTFIGRVALERDRYAGLKAQLLELSAPRDERPEPRELLALAHGVRARAALAEVLQLLEAARARAAALRARTARRGRR